MPDCTCAEDWRAIPKDRRILVHVPGKIHFDGQGVVKEAAQGYVFDKDCPAHGYKEIVNGE
jgi:hypothetical protein